MEKKRQKFRYKANIEPFKLKIVSNGTLYFLVHFFKKIGISIEIYSKCNKSDFWS